MQVNPIPTKKSFEYTKLIRGENYHFYIQLTNYISYVDNIKLVNPKIPNTGIPRFTLLMWGHIKKTRKEKTA
jgi:hypothetical protein